MRLWRGAVFFLFAVVTMVADPLVPALSGQQGPATGGGASLQPGDLIRIVIWREEDLSGDFLVDERGTVVLPMLGSVYVAGTSADALRDQLLERYNQELRNPSIQITPLRRIIVLGSVQIPGLQEVDPTISLAAVIALAGGPNAEGDAEKIQVVRGGEIFQERVSATASLNAVDIRSGDQIFVGKRSWLERNTSFVAGTAVSLFWFVLSQAL